MPKLVDYEGWKQTLINNGNWNTRHNTNVLFQCSKCLRWDPSKAYNFTIFNVDEQITCHHCHKQTMSKSWTCPCGENWFVCNTHKWYAKDGKPTKSPDDTNSRPTKSTKIDHHATMKQNVQHDGDKNPKPNKAQKKEHTVAGVPIQGECDPNLMASHQELLKYELKCENNKITNPGKNRPKDIALSLPGNLVKKPRLWGPKNNAKFDSKFGDQAPKYSEDEMDKAKKLGETARKRCGDNVPAKGDNQPHSVKKPKLTGAQSSFKIDGRF